MDAWKASTLLELAYLYNGAWRSFARACGLGTGPRGGRGGAPGVGAGRCWLCNARGGSSGLCAACERDLPWQRPPERRRAIAGIGVCRVPLSYRFPVSRVVHAAKFRRDMSALAVLARLTAREVSTYVKDYDYLLPVPLAPSRFVSRGFNQATGIARELERATGVVVRTGVAKRIRAGAPQSSLPGAARAENVRNAFAVRRAVHGDTVLIVDDVVTTGSTLAALAGALRRAGARHVDAVVATEAAR